MKPTPRSPSVRLLAALPDGVSAAFFLSVWLSPLALGSGAVKTALLMMLVEFVLLHASVALGQIAVAQGRSRRIRLGAVLGFAAVYLSFVAAFCIAFEAWWPIPVFLCLMVSKLAVIMDRRAPPTEQQLRMQSAWAIAVMAYLAGAFLSVFAPIPRLGMTTSLQPLFDLPGSGHWVADPHTVVAFGTFYFGLQAWSRWRDWVLPAQDHFKS